MSENKTAASHIQPRREVRLSDEFLLEYLAEIKKRNFTRNVSEIARELQTSNQLIKERLEVLRASGQLEKTGLRMERVGKMLGVM